jgi:hypothetical protein
VSEVLVGRQPQRQQVAKVAKYKCAAAAALAVGHLRCNANRTFIVVGGGCHHTGYCRSMRVGLILWRQNIVARCIEIHATFKLCRKKKRRKERKKKMRIRNERVSELKIVPQDGR